MHHLVRYPRPAAPAQDNGRKTVTAVHKATIHKLGDGLFLECCREVAQAVRGARGCVVEAAVACLLGAWSGSLTSLPSIATPYCPPDCLLVPQYPALKYEEVIIDSAMLHMASNPSRFDVMVMPNLYGDIAS
jgi:isocitrate dehydrogenase (NAD+)